MASLLALTLLIIGRLVDFVLVDDVHSYTRIMLEELYNCPENIDTLFLGPNRCYKSVDPAIFTEVTGKKAFNAGTSQQLADGAWFLLRIWQSVRTTARILIAWAFFRAETFSQALAFLGRMLGGFRLSDCILGAFIPPWGWTEWGF